MDYDFRNRAYDSQYSAYTRPPSSSPMYGPSFYPRPPHTTAHPHSASPSSSSSGLGIRVAIKPEYRITLPPMMSQHAGDIPRSHFQFDFEFEKRILSEAVTDTQNWSRIGLENLPSGTTESASSSASVANPVVSKYIASGLNREAVPLAVAKYGDDPTKVREFVNGYTLLREMGFSSNNVAEALVTYELDTDKALAHFLNSS